MKPTYQIHIINPDQTSTVHRVLHETADAAEHVATRIAAGLEPGHSWAVTHLDAGQTAEALSSGCVLPLALAEEAE